MLYGAVEETTVSSTVVNTLCISSSLPATRYTEGENLAQHIVVEEGLLYSCCLCRDFTSRHRPLIEEHLRKFCRKRQPVRVTGGEAHQVGLIIPFLSTGGVYHVLYKIISAVHFIIVSSKGLYVMSLYVGYRWALPLPQT